MSNKCVFLDRRQIARMLIQKPGTDVNIKDTSERTPLQLAAANGYFVQFQFDDIFVIAHCIYQCNFISGFGEFISLLLQNGGDVNAKDNNGYQALHIATKNGHDKVVEILLANGAKFNEKTNDGKLAVSIAIEKSQ